ncbi:MAG: polysaccharide biosynthesis/export family protein [Pyrinomonadaceae bacterium]
MLIQRFLRIAIVGLVATGSAHVATAQATKSADATTAQSSERYRIGPGDVLEIRVYNRPQLSRDTVRVEGNGMIRMPLVEGDVQAACKTEGELAKEISARYARYYRNLPVDVFIKEYRAREVALIGAVNEQGRYQMQRHIRLLELLTFAKGPSEKAGQTINIVRGPRADVCGQNSSTVTQEGLISLLLNKTMRGDESANPYVEAGDIVTIPEAEQVYVVGNVYAPKSVALRESLTVSRAIAMAGGPLRDSKTDRVHIVRHSPAAGGQSEIYVNLTAIARKKEDDLVLQANDIIEVPESTGKSIIRSLMGAVAPSVAQVPVRIIP